MSCHARSQFLIGTIKTKLVEVAELFVAMYQFLIGTIKTIESTNAFRRFAGEFQFLISTIKTESDNHTAVVLR